MEYYEVIPTIRFTERIRKLKEKTLCEERYLSLEQVKLITECYKKNETLPKNLQRAISLAYVMEKISIRIEPEELIVGNRTAGVRAGVVSPDSGISWIDKEIETLPYRHQDRFNVRKEDIEDFRREILPYWSGKSLEDRIKSQIGTEIDRISKVVKINQIDHAQGHICPNVKKWLTQGPAGILDEAKQKYKASKGGKRDFYQGVITVLAGSQVFIKRYGQLAKEMAARSENSTERESLAEISRICFKLSVYPPETFHEALQAVWFLFVLLQLESNASSFSPGRMDQYLYPYFKRDYESGDLTLDRALELIEALWLKFNQIVYMRNAQSAKYFAGFPIGFNVAFGGQTIDGQDASNILSHLFLKAQDHLGLPQPNLSARLFKGSPDPLIDECSRVIGLGSGMPQIFNDESIIPALEKLGISHKDAVNYAVVGCVELSTHGNTLGWSDAAMFNMVKALELAMNNGRCMLTGEQIGPETGYLSDFSSYNEFEMAYKQQLDHFIDQMIKACDAVDRLHAEVLPSPFLSSVIDDCLEKGIDIAAGGAHYNFSGIQAIQVANITDSLAVIKKLVYDEKTVEAEELLKALRANFSGYEELRTYILNHVPKYGNDVSWVDESGFKWIEYFARKLTGYTNARGGPYHMGLYTVSAHVPMGQNVAATPDGRRSQMPLADGGMSAMAGRDKNGPTALLKSVARLNSKLASNGTLLNMKFLPDFFKNKSDLKKFSALLKGFVRLKIHHVQFNVVRREDLIAAKQNPNNYRGLTVRVAGYTAHYTELAEELQDEIISRTSFGG